jgi:DNA helicase-2/ATP-dependent DNA helicase PcrA
VRREALAGPPPLDEDYLILSTIHSAKGQEWDTLFVLNAADGCIPSDLATGHPAEIEEERRLLYVAMTRAKNSLSLIHPLRFFIRQQSRLGERHVFTPRTRFIPDSILDRFERVVPLAPSGPGPTPRRLRVRESTSRQDSERPGRRRHGERRDSRGTLCGVPRSRRRR